MLEKEKEVMFVVYEDGREDEYQFHVNGLDEDMFEEYYNNKFGEK